MPAVLLKIGAFAERAAVTVKTVRYYDKAGVLRPAHVDAKSGYRYYHIDQLANLAHLRLLRELGATVADLSAWVAANGDVAAQRVLLGCLRERLRQSLSRDRDRLRYLEQWMREVTLGRNLSPVLRPKVRNLPEMPAFTLRDRVNNAGSAIYRMFESAEQVAARESARAPHRPFLILYDGYGRKQKADVEVCIPIHASAMTAVGGRIVESVPRAICLSFGGSYDHGPSVLASLHTWARLKCARVVGPLRESYIRFGADQLGYRLRKQILAEKEADYRTELQLPIATS
jgi:DNA-binding transcriptional MerR regulator